MLIIKQMIRSGCFSSPCTAAQKTNCSFLLSYYAGNDVVIVAKPLQIAKIIRFLQKY